MSATRAATTRRGSRAAAIGVRRHGGKLGGTSFAGGIGTIPGAVLGAFVMQSLAYGLSFIGVNSPGQNVVAGIVLIIAVAFDTLNRRRSTSGGVV